MKDKETIPCQYSQPAEKHAFNTTVHDQDAQNDKDNDTSCSGNESEIEALDDRIDELVHAINAI